MAKKNTSNAIKTASVLAFERKLDPSDGILSGGLWDDRKQSGTWTPIQVREKSVRGTASSRQKAGENDPAKLNLKIESPNLQRVDVATLPTGADTLRVHFTLRVLPGTGTPCACNDAGYQSKLLATVRSYVDAQGFKVLAGRYAVNLANGRFLWRNRIGAESVEVIVRQISEGKVQETWTFDSLSLSLRKFGEDENVKSLAKAVAKGLAGPDHVLLQVVAHVRIGQGQEVFPSQELILDRGTDKKGQKSKTLYSVREAAAIHSQKIGNALRTIDTWYPECTDLGPIAVEPYGSVTSQGKAYRQPKQKVDFYSLLDGWVLRDEIPTVEHQHFVIANLIRGGVFGESEKD